MFNSCHLKILCDLHSFYYFQRAFCAYCNDRIWGLGRQGFKCIQCKLLVHKKCHKAVHKPCTTDHQDPIGREEHNGEGQAISTPVNDIVPDIRERDFPEPPPDVTGKAINNINRYLF